MLKTLEIDGYRPFREARVELLPLNVLVGANASGKSSLFEFLRFLSDGMRDDIPPEIIPGPSGRSLFHLPGSEQFTWAVEFAGPTELTYRGKLLGPVGRPRIVDESVQGQGVSSFRASLQTTEDDGRHRKVKLVGAGVEPGSDGWMDSISVRPQRLALGLVFNEHFRDLFELRRQIDSWRFFDAARLNTDKIRQPALAEQEPALAEDGSNLSAVLHYLALEHREQLERIQLQLGLIVPGFRKLTIKSRGGPGQVLAFWQEERDVELSLADLSDGSLRLLCWLTLIFHPNPPALITIDEPEQGLHPRALASLAGFFADLATRTQVILATHSSIFLSYFRLEDMVVIRRDKGCARFWRPASSQLLLSLLQEFKDEGSRAEAVENLHRSDELEFFS